MIESIVLLIISIFAAPCEAKSAIADGDAIAWIATFGVLMCLCCCVVAKLSMPSSSYSEFEDDVEMAGAKKPLSFKKVVAERNKAIMHHKEKQRLKENFETVDTNKNGVLDENEIVELMCKISEDGPADDTRAAAKETLKEFGSNGSINYEQFALYWHIQLMKREDWLRSTFDKLAEENTATLDPADFGKLFPQVSKDRLETLKKGLTLNENGMMGFEEFKASLEPTEKK